jgi:hypothetical protein
MTFIELLYSPNVEFEPKSFLIRITILFPFLHYYLIASTIFLSLLTLLEQIVSINRHLM